MIFWVADVDAMYDHAVAGGYVPEMTPADAPWGERYFHVATPTATSSASPSSSPSIEPAV